MHRVYCALRLNLPRRTRRRVPTRFRQPLVAPARLNETWALDFMADARYDGRSFRTFNVLDEGNREALAIEIGTSIPRGRVIRALDDCVRRRRAAEQHRTSALRVRYNRAVMRQGIRSALLGERSVPDRLPEFQRR